MSNYRYSTAGRNVQGKGAKEPGANKPERANKPGGELAKGRKSLAPPYFYWPKMTRVKYVTLQIKNK